MGIPTKSTTRQDTCYLDMEFAEGGCWFLVYVVGKNSRKNETLRACMT